MGLLKNAGWLFLEVFKADCVSLGDKNSRVGRSSVVKCIFTIFLRKSKIFIVNHKPGLVLHPLHNMEETSLIKH